MASNPGVHLCRGWAGVFAHAQCLWTHQAIQRHKGSGKKKIHPSGGAGRRHSLSVGERKAWGRAQPNAFFCKLHGSRCFVSGVGKQVASSPSSQLVPSDTLPLARPPCFPNRYQPRIKHSNIRADGGHFHTS